MIDKYYNGVIEQVYSRVGKAERNIVMASYNNDFSIGGLENIERYQQQDDNVFLAWHEFGYGILANAYEPFLDTICNMYRKYDGGNFDDFLSECEVYDLHRKLLRGYYEDGSCCREESVLLKEVVYEQNRMTEALANMLREIAQKHPVVIVINRFQLASRSTMELVRNLLVEPSKNIGLVLGANEMQPRVESASGVWDSIVECLTDNNQIYHIGSSGKFREQDLTTAFDEDYFTSEDYYKMFEKLEHIFAFLDYDQVQCYCQEFEHKIKFEDAPIEDCVKRDFYLIYARTSILLAELSKALELVSEMQRMDLPDEDHYYRLQCAFLKSTCLMYQGKLDKALKYARVACGEAEANGDSKQKFLTELLVVMTRMAGWYNIFFYVQDIPIAESLVEKMMKYNYKNHLAHIYIYAYDNRPEVVAKAYRSEAALFFFSKGVELAKEIGNEQLVEDAYQKNIMLASTNGMNEIAMLYSVRSYQFMKSKNGLSAGRIFSGIGYNLSAMGNPDEANKYYNWSIEMFYKLRLPEEIAEVYYNRALNYIMQGRYAQAEHDLQMGMKVIEKLHLNSLRVCNLSKLYGLLALSCILQKDRFGCERYLLSCRQFLNYIIEKEKDNQNAEVIHDYAKCDDDMFLYTFSFGLLNRMDGDDEAALANFEAAEKFLLQAEGNQFFSYRLFRQERMELFQKLGRTERYEREKVSLQQHEELNRQIAQALPKSLLQEVSLGDYSGESRISEEEIESLIKQEGVMRDYLSTKRQMEFISVWQKMIDVSANDISEMVQGAIRIFINHFSLDCALYICYQDNEPHVLYNDTRREMTEEVLAGIRRAMKEYPQGFAVSKISDSFLEHEDIISFFGVDDVCSFVAVPFMKNGKMTSLLITYVWMKDNWHGSIERYMLNEDDLNIYKLLFREMEYSINRMEANIKIYEMNSKLQDAAVTDMLTGIYNRAGMYERVHQMAERIGASGKPQRMGLMFIDLDNFKHYNDTYGHDVGDIILKEMAVIFRSASEDNGFVSRFGGDEFIIILDTDDKDELEDLAKEIYRRIEAMNGFKEEIEKHLGHTVQMDEGRLITCSMGIARAEDVCTEDDIDRLIRKADDMLYSVKTGEKGHYAFL